MEVTITLPSGKEVTYTKGKNGVKTVFISKENSALIVQTETETLNFLNYPCVITFTKEIE